MSILENNHTYKARRVLSTAEAQGIVESRKALYLRLFSLKRIYNRDFGNRLY